MTFTGAWYTPVVPADDGSTSPVAYCYLMTALIVDATDDNDFTGMPALPSRCDDDSSDDENDDEITPSPKKIGHRQRCKAPFNIETMMLEAEAESGMEFVETENWCELKNTIDSSGFDNITVM
jgi:hypothetical protein